MAHGGNWKIATREVYTLNFLHRIDHLKASYPDDECGTRDAALLYGVCNPSPPLAKHIIFAPAPTEILNNMIDSYKRSFPRELKFLYTVMNGANMFWTSVKVRSTTIPRCGFSLYGIPLTYDRRHIEPFNISIEDLHRPKDAPISWLKIGHYYAPEAPACRLDLFVDTDSNCVFAVEHDQSTCIVKATWSSIDECLCYVFDILKQQ